MCEIFLLGACTASDHPHFASLACTVVCSLREDLADLLEVFGEKEEGSPQQVC